MAKSAIATCGAGRGQSKTLTAPPTKKPRKATHRVKRAAPNGDACVKKAKLSGASSSEEAKNSREGVFLPALAVVDCGSGSSRMSVYSLHPDGFVHEDKYVPSSLPTLAPAIGANQHQQWIDKLADLLSFENPALRVVVGSTGGLRKALSGGQVTEAQVQAFSEALEARFPGADGPRVQLVHLSGSEEAELELVAGRYLARHALKSVRPNFGGGIQEIREDEIGLLSCGGASSQIAYNPHLQFLDPSHSSTQFLSLETDLIGFMESAKKYGRQAWNGDAFAYTEDLLWKRIAEAGAPLGKLRGTFVGMTLAAAICQEAGLAGRLVPKREAVQLLTQHLESMQRMAGKDLEEMQMGGDAVMKGPESVTFYQEARIPLVIITLALLDLFSSQAWFFFTRSFVIGSPDNELWLQWPLGLFLKQTGLDKLPQPQLQPHGDHSANGSS